MNHYETAYVQTRTHGAVIPLIEIGEFALDFRLPVLIEDFVNSTSEAFWIGIREFLIVV